MYETNGSNGRDTQVANSTMSKLKRWLIWPTLCWDRQDSKRKDWKAILFLTIAIILLLNLIVWCTFMSAIRNDDPDLRYSEPILKEEKHCETIHLATVCGGYQSTNDFRVLLNSILFYRKANKIHYHLFVDKISSKIITKLFETWPVPNLNISLYNISNYEDGISWITNSHYSNHYGLLKLMLPSILAKEKVSRVILLDTDMIVLGDIVQIWRSFSQFVRTSFLGLVENQSDWYLIRKETIALHVRPNVWPAIGRGYNTGLMLIDLEKAVDQGWDKLWREIAATELVEHLYTSLADQDIYNAVIKRHSRIVTKLPCHLNLQVNDHTNIDNTCPDHEDRAISVVHWNSPSKLKTTNEKADYFRSWYQTFQDWNGKLLQREVCSDPKARKKVVNHSWFGQDIKSEEELLHQLQLRLNPCLAIHPQPADVLRTVLYAREFELAESDNDSSNISITAVVHLTLDRLQSLEDLAAHWMGPISASIYLNDAETSLLLKSVEESKVLSSRKNIGYHLVFKIIGWYYPINKMRNIALENVITPYVFLTDVDFLPSNTLEHHLRETIKKEFRYLSRTALVVPAFENRQYRLEFPENKEDLIKQLDLGKMVTFRQEEWPEGQEQTNYAKWRQATKPYLVDWRHDYEPYIVTGKDVRKFDERFIGFGWNKVEHSLRLAANGYRFLVLSEAFMIHQNHAASLELKAFRNDKDFRKCIEYLKNDVVTSTRSEYTTY